MGRPRDRPDTDGGTLLYRAKRVAVLTISKEQIALAKDGGESAHVRGRRDSPVTLEEFGDLDGLATKVDWVAKHRLLERYRERHGLPLSHPKVALMDLTYFVAFSGVVEDALRSRRLPGIDVGHDAEIAVVLNRVDAGHLKSSEKQALRA